MPDFWKSSGFHLLMRDGDGRLRVTDDFLRAYLRRPELSPVEESCAAERALHAKLLDDPRAQATDDDLARIADPDAQENYRLMLDFRDRLLSAKTIENAYLSAYIGEAGPMAPLFLDHLAHVIVRNMLDGTDDPLRARAGEILFRSQKINVAGGAIMSADAEIVDMYATTGGFGALGQLVSEAKTPMRSVDLDVIGEANGALYWARADAHDTVLDLSFGHPGLDALCRVLEIWVDHLLAVRVRIQPVERISDERWVWHLGLDVEASALLNDLYNGVDVDEGAMERLLSLFRLEFEDSSLMRADIAGKPVYMAMAMTPDKTLRLKPQNLLVNLPLASRA